jgi:hypothetical protein
MLMNTDPYTVSGYGLMVGLANTGGNENTPVTIRNYMIDEMVRHGFNLSWVDERYKHMQPERILEDHATSIVTVTAALPPGARHGQRIDVNVEALAGTSTSSLAHGQLYRTGLRIDGANPFRPGGSINEYAAGAGEVTVNALNAADPSTRPSVANSLRRGTVMDGGVVVEDRPLWLRLRHPEFPVARQIESRVNQVFQDNTVAKAQDDGFVYIYMPNKRFNGDWQRFTRVVNHIYLNGSPDFVPQKAKELAAAAVQPGAPLEDISYCWEALGSAAQPYIRPLYASSSPDVAFAAARAGAAIGDVSAHDVLLAMARSDAHPFQLAAVTALGQLPKSPRVDRMLDSLLDASRSTVRIQAYRILASHEYWKVMSKSVNKRFTLDVIPTDGPGLIYATRSGSPRVALFGKNLAVNLPMTFTAMNMQFTMTSRQRDSLTLFYRGNDLPKAISAKSGPELQEIVLRLGGESKDGFQLGYGDIVGILQSLCDHKDVPAAFVFEDRSKSGSDLEAPVIQDIGTGGRPLGDKPTTVPLLDVLR